MDFFGFLQNKSQNISPIKIHYHDEIGVMGNKVNEKAVIGEASKVIENTGNGTLVHCIQIETENETLQKMVLY